MKKIIYILSKNNTVKNYVSTFNTTIKQNNTVGIELLFDLDINKAIDLKDDADFICTQLVKQFGHDSVGIIETE